MPSGLPPQPPPGFSYPSPAGYATGVVSALGPITADWARDNMEAPVAASTMVLKGAISASAGTSFSSLLGVAQSGLIGTTTAGTIAGVVGGLVQGSVPIIQSVAKASGAIGGAAAAIPVLGAIVGMVLEGIVTALGYPARQAAAQDETKGALQAMLNSWCPQVAKLQEPFGTGGQGAVVPSDFFRKLAFEYTKFKQGNDYRLPMNVSSMYLMLCGGETQGFGLSRAQYNAVLAAQRKRNPALGIPASTQRRMWKLIQGIMLSVQPPIAAAPIGDEGRSLMPILQEIVRRNYTGPGMAGRWDDGFARALSDQVTRHYSKTAYGPGAMAYTGTCAGSPDNVPRYVDLTPGLISSVVEYQFQLREQFWDAGNQRWNLYPKDSLIAPTQTGTLIMDKRFVALMAKNIETATGEGRSGLQWLALLAASAGAGYGSYWAGRKYRLLAK